jgi:hypothetical protein
MKLRTVFVAGGLTLGHAALSPAPDLKGPGLGLPQTMLPTWGRLDPMRAAATVRA